MDHHALRRAREPCVSFGFNDLQVNLQVDLIASFSPYRPNHITRPLWECLEVAWPKEVLQQVKLDLESWTKLGISIYKKVR